MLITEAKEIAIGNNDGAIYTKRFSNLYKFNAPTDSIYIFNLISDDDTLLELYDSEGVLLKIDDNSGSNLDARIQFSLNEGLDYYLIVYFKYSFIATDYQLEVLDGANCEWYINTFAIEKSFYNFNNLKPLDAYVFSSFINPHSFNPETREVTFEKIECRWNISYPQGGNYPINHIAMKIGETYKNDYLGFYTESGVLDYMAHIPNTWAYIKELSNITIKFNEEEWDNNVRLDVIADGYYTLDFNKLNPTYTDLMREQQYFVLISHISYQYIYFDYKTKTISFQGINCTWYVSNNFLPYYEYSISMNIENNESIIFDSFYGREYIQAGEPGVWIFYATTYDVTLQLTSEQWDYVVNYVYY